jgi:hypothetical protein
MVMPVIAPIKEVPRRRQIIIYPPKHPHYDNTEKETPLVQH